MVKLLEAALVVEEESLQVEVWVVAVELAGGLLVSKEVELAAKAVRVFRYHYYLQ